MIERREFISICRQIGAMMEVGVDFLRITQALRAQTDNPRLLELYDQLDADLKEGDSLSEAMSHAPDVFSAFAVSLVQQGEARGNIESAWERIADFFRQQAREDLEIGDDDTPLERVVPTASSGVPSTAPAVGTSRAMSERALSELFDRVEAALGRALLGVALLLACLGAARALSALGVVPREFQTLVELGTAALFLAIAGAWVLAQKAAKKKRSARCAFCGRTESRDLPLARSALGEGAAICASCAAQLALGAGTPENEAARAQEKEERFQALRHVADALPENNGVDDDDDTIVLDEDDPLAPPASPLR